MEEDWVLQINDEVNSNNAPSTISENEKWKRHSIYKVHSRVIALNEKAYYPKVVSFGPYHNGEDKLKAMEQHKHRALVHFLKRCKKPIQLVLQQMDQVVDELIDSYESLDPIWMQDKTKFLKMMILDGCFMLEILRAISEGVPEDYAANDPVFSKHGKLYVIPLIRRDMYMLENQLPMKVLRILNEVETGTSQDDDDEILNEQILYFFCNPCPQPMESKEKEKMCKIKSIGKCLHVLDVYRKYLIQQVPTKQPRVRRRTCRRWWCNKAREEEDIVRSAAELHEAGIGFRKSETQSLRDVSFDDDKGILRLPKLKVDGMMQYVFLNLMAFERVHIEAENTITWYVYLMDKLIDTERDVALLHKKGILTGALGSDKAVADLFNSLTNEITVSEHGDLEPVLKSMSDYCKKPWNSWRAHLIQNYFRNPWAMVSLIAAIFLFTLTIIQTVYTIADYYKSDAPPSSPVTPPPRPLLRRP